MMIWKSFAIQPHTILVLVLMAGAMLMSCSSTQETQPRPSKQEIRQDSDRFFQKMEQEEGKQSPSR
jgi:hypothetical protein